MSRAFTIKVILIPKLVEINTSLFLTKQKFLHLSIQKILSWKIFRQSFLLEPILSGVLKGSILRQALSNIDTYDLRQQHKSNISYSIYADDVAITASARQNRQVHLNLQIKLNPLKRYKYKYFLWYPTQTQSYYNKTLSQYQSSWSHTGLSHLSYTFTSTWSKTSSSIQNRLSRLQNHSNFSH